MTADAANAIVVVSLVIAAGAAGFGVLIGLVAAVRCFARALCGEHGHGPMVDGSSGTLGGRTRHESGRLGRSRYGRHQRVRTEELDGDDGDSDGDSDGDAIRDAAEEVVCSAGGAMGEGHDAVDAILCHTRQPRCVRTPRAIMFHG